MQMRSRLVWSHCHLPSSTPYRPLSVIGYRRLSTRFSVYREGSLVTLITSLPFGVISVIFRWENRVPPWEEREGSIAGHNAECGQQKVR